MTPIQKFVSELLLDFVVYGTHDLVEGGVFTGIPYSPTSFSCYLDWVYDTLDCDLRLRRQDHPDLTQETLLDLCQNEQVVFDVYEFLEKVFPILAVLDHDSMDYHERYLSLLIDETQTAQYFEPIKVEDDHFPSPPPLMRQNGICGPDIPPLEVDPPVRTTSEIAFMKKKLDAVASKYNDEEVAPGYTADSDGNSSALPVEPLSGGDGVLDGGPGTYPESWSSALPVEPRSEGDDDEPDEWSPISHWPKKKLLAYAEQCGLVGVKSLSKEKLATILLTEETIRPYYSSEKLRAILESRGVPLKAKMSKKQLLALF